MNKIEEECSLEYNPYLYSIKSPSFQMLYPPSTIADMNKRYLSEFDKYSQCCFDFKTLTMSFQPCAKFEFYEVLNTCGGNLYERVKQDWQPSIKSLPSSFQRAHSTQKYETGEYSQLLEKWCKQIINFLSYSYGFESPKKHIPTMQLRILLREISRTQKEILVKIVMLMISKFIERIKYSMHSYYATAQEMLCKEPVPAADSVTYNNITAYIDSLFKPIACSNNDMHLDKATLANSPNNNFVANLVKSYNEVERVIQNTRPFYNLLVEHINIKNMGITFEDIHWRLFYENVYLETNFNRTLLKFITFHQKSEMIVLIDKISKSLANMKDMWNKKLSILTPVLKAKLAQKLMMNENGLEFKHEDAIINTMNLPIFCNLEEPPLPCKKKKKRRRKKKTPKKEEKKEDESSEGEEIKEEVDDKPLMVPNIAEDKIRKLERILLEKMKGKQQK